MDIPGYSEAVEVGRGGFGVVYRAQQPAYRRTVAIKILRASVDGRTRERFERECMALGSLSHHPNIVTLFDAGLTEAGDPYIVTEYLGGGSLEDLVDRDTPVGWKEAVDNGIRLAGALHTSHQAGILHRDVKPRNVLLSNFGDLRLVDFGLARLKGSLETRQGDVMGSVAYAAPEILDGQAPTVASDVYSLGATIFSLFWGRPPFATDDEQMDIQVVARIATAPVPDARLIGVPDVVCKVLERAMAKHPAERFASAEELGAQLQAAQAALGLPVTPMALEKASPSRTEDLTSGRAPGPANGSRVEPDRGQTVRWAAPADGEGPVVTASPPAAAHPPAKPLARPSLRERLRLPDTAPAWSPRVLIGTSIGIVVILLLGVVALVTAGSDDEQSAEPAKEGRYRYRIATSGDLPPLQYPEGLSQVTTASRRGEEILQTVTRETDDGSTERAALVWTPAGLYEDETVQRRPTGAQTICDWMPDVLLLPFPIRAGAQPVVETMCRTSPQTVSNRVMRSRVLRSGRENIGGRSVRVWEIERSETRTTTTANAGDVVVELTGTDMFAPAHGLVVRSHYDVKTVFGDRALQSTVDFLVLSLNPV